MQNIPPQQPPTQPPEYQQGETQPGFQPPPIQQPGGSPGATSQPAQQSPVGTHWFTFSQLRGHPLVDISTGEKIGEVGDILLDEHRRMAQAFVSKVGLVHLHGPTYIPLVNASIGRDAITFQPKALTVQDLAILKALPKVSEMIGINVLSNIGELIGTVDNARFDQNNGELLALEIKPGSTGLKQRLLGSGNMVLPISGIISFGPNIIADANTIAGM